jgi:hypothetical protein
MNRRKFLKRLGVGVVVVAVAPTALQLVEPASVAAPGYATYVMGQNAVISEYCNYVNFSDFAITGAIDEQVKETANELAYRFRVATDIVQRRRDA